MRLRSRLSKLVTLNLRCRRSLGFFRSDGNLLELGTHRASDIQPIKPFWFLPMGQTLRVVVLKPSKYTVDGRVERFRWGFMPNSTVPYLRSMTPAELNGVQLQIHAVDEYVHSDLQYLSFLDGRHQRTLLALVGVQSHQFHRALDLAAYGRRNGCSVVVGGPHIMTCDTSMLQGCGISFALSEAELVWSEILHDAAQGQLQPIYGADLRWQQELDAPVVIPPPRKDLNRYVMPMLGLYPARGCPFLCNFCSVIKIAGRQIRSQSVDTTLRSLHAAKKAGIRTIMFTSDNFNKYPQAANLLEAMIASRLQMKFFIQCDTQLARQQRFVELLARAGCYQIFVGVESFNRRTLLAAQKGQNRPETYRDIVRLCRAYGISSHFSNIIGFPQDTVDSVHEHLAQLMSLRATWASFYILCPIPGTEQYDDFLAQGLICEKNLDRFDTTCLTWRHPQFTAGQLKQLLFACYRKFNSLKHALQNMRDEISFGPGQALGNCAGSFAMSLFNCDLDQRTQGAVEPLAGV